MPDPIPLSGGAPTDRPAVAEDRCAGTYGIYDYYRRGTEAEQHSAERLIGERVAALVPHVREHAEHNQRFRHHAPRYLATESGVRDFLDIGYGRPSATEPDLHDVLWAAVPDARVVYVDHDRTVVEHGEKVLAADRPGNVTMVEGDLRRPEEILAHPEITRVLDLTRPVAIGLHAVLHFIVDEEDPGGLVARLLEPLPVGSFVTLTHGTTVLPVVPEIHDIYREAGLPLRFRSRERIVELVDGMELLDPGIVPVQDWAPPGRPPSPSGLPDGETLAYVLVARKRA